MTQGENTRQQPTDAWSREARRVQERVQRRGRELSEEDLVLLDVRDLQALAASQGGRADRSRIRWMVPPGLRTAVRDTSTAAPSARRA